MTYLVPIKLTVNGNIIQKLVEPNQHETSRAIIDMLKEECEPDFDSLDSYLQGYTWENYTKKIIKHISDAENR